MSCTVVQINVTKIFVTGTRIAKEFFLIVAGAGIEPTTPSGVIAKIAP